MRRPGKLCSPASARVATRSALCTQRIWPALNGIIGRQAGQQEGYVYTDAMKNSGLVWTREALRTYIKDPSAVVPHPHEAVVDG